jgi:hypothetical protein
MISCTFFVSACAPEHRSRRESIPAQAARVLIRKRKVKSRRADDPTRLTLVLLSRWLNWRDALTVVRPKTFVAWHRKGFRHFCRRKSEAGRRPIPVMLQHLICCFDSSLFGETLSGVTLFTVCPVKIGSRHKNGTR